MINDCCCNKKIDMSCHECDSCNSCGPCCPAQFDCTFDIQADAYDPRFWMFNINGCTKKVKLPELPEKPTYLDLDCSSKTMTYYGETDTQVFTGEQIGCLLSLDDISDVNAPNPEPCSMLVYNPGCGRCPCTPEEATWQAYQIPDAGDCVIDPDEEGYYHVLVKNDCGCIEECRLPVVPSGMISLNYMRDSVPDDPDFPYYYGCYNDTINLYLAQNAPAYFGKYALKVTVNYGIQACRSDQTPNYNFRSLMVPQIAGQSINVQKEASVLQGFAIFSATAPLIPWGTAEMRGSFTFIVPKGKEASLHHEYRIRLPASIYPDWQNWGLNPTYDGKRVPDDIASQVDAFEWAASRLHSLQVIIEPTVGVPDYEPEADPERSQLDPPVDEYPIN